MKIQKIKLLITIIDCFKLFLYAITNLENHHNWSKIILIITRFGSFQWNFSIPFLPIFSILVKNFIIYNEKKYFSIFVKVPICL